MKRKKTTQIKLVMATILVLVVLFTTIATKGLGGAGVATNVGDSTTYTPTPTMMVTGQLVAPSSSPKYSTQPKVQETVKPELIPEPTPELVTSPYPVEVLDAVALTLAGECYDDEVEDKTNVCWTICNRVEDGNFGDGFIGVLTKKYQFDGYWHQSREVSGNDYAVAKEVLDAYYAGAEPKHDCLYFSGGTDKTNNFSHTWK